ncbi:MAG: carboxypeptidase regulatory-like domain-containing protein, partial [Pseudomonadota bacterium]
MNRPLSGQDKYTGHITGMVTTTKGEPIRGALIEAYGQAGKRLQEKPASFAFSDQKGKYFLDLPVGTYTLKIKAPKFREREFGKVSIKPADEANIPIRLLADVPILIDEMRVIAKKIKKTSEKAQLAERKASSNVVETMGAETIAKIPESDVSGILTRMAGVVMDQGKYMQARGMTKRYNNTTLNGSSIPTTRPNEKLTPLDLFQGGIVDSISVAKTFTPDLPGNFSGGLCQIKTKAIPDAFIAKLSFTSSYNSVSTFDRYLYAHGGKKDWMGFDDGTRELPDSIPKAQVRGRGKFSKTGFDPNELERFGESFKNNWNIHSGKAPVNTDYSLYVGDRWNKFGAVVSLYYKSDVKSRADEERNIFTTTPGGGVRVDSSYKFKNSTQYIKEGCIVNFGLDIDADNKIYCKNFYNRNTSDEARMYEGLNSDKNENIRVSRLRYIEEEMYAGQIAGDHAVDRLLKSNIKWRYNYSFGNMY